MTDSPSPNSIMTTGRTKLHEAAYKGDVEAVTRLLESGFDINCGNKFKETALHLAAFRGNVAVLRVLLKHGAKVDAKNCNLKTPLHRAIDSHKEESVEILLSHGANVNAQDDKGKTPLHVSVDHCSHRITDLLLGRNPNLELHNHEKHTPLHHATIKGKIDMMKKLMKAGADPYNLNNNGNTGAHHAAFNGRQGVLRVLLLEGFDVNFKNIENNTLLHLASRQGHMEVVELLIEKNACLDSYNKSGSSPVHLAAAVGCTNIVVRLLEKGANPYNPSTGYSVLHAAASNNRINTIQVVVTMFPEKISINATWRKLLAEDLASIAGGRDSLWWLRKQSQYQSRPESHLVANLAECKSNYEKIGSVFVRRGKFVNKERIRIEREAKSLQKSIEDGHAEMHYMDPKGNTILHEAMESGNEIIADMLIKNGALITARNYRNLTPVDVAQKDSEYAKYGKLDFQDSRYDAFLHSLLLSVIAQTVGLEVDKCRNKEHIQKYEECLDRDVQGLKLEITKIFSELMSKAIIYDPVGSCGRHILPLAISTNNRTLLPMLLASGFPLTTNDSGLGIVQLAWLTPDITTWVAMVVTRAVMNQLHSECDALMKVSSVDSHVEKLLFILHKAIPKLMEDLNGLRPWEAQFKIPDHVTPTQLYVTASSYGATLTAWYIWRAGASNFERAYPYSGCNALEAALSSKCFLTAFRLVVDMGANPFLKNAQKELAINSFPDEMRLLEVMLGKEYRILDKKLEKSKDEKEKKKIQGIIILFIVLFLQFKVKQRSEKWKPFLYLILAAHSKLNEEQANSNLWMISLEKILLEDGIEGMKFAPAARYPEMKWRILVHAEKLTKIVKNLAFVNEEDDFCSLFHILDSNFSDPVCLENDLDNNRNFSLQMKHLFQKGLKYACEEEMPLFLHLLISVAKTPVDLVLDKLCKSLPLHHAAQKGMNSAVVYLLECGASSFGSDASKITPLQYALMFGHQSTAEIFSSQVTTANTARVSHVACNNDDLLYLDYHNIYLELFGLDPKDNVKSRYFYVQSQEKLLSDRFRYIEHEWKNKGINNATSKIVVDFKDGEAKEIKTTVLQFLSELQNIISEKDSNFAGEIQLVGSSEDNVRLCSPDEYDCNLILSNIRAYPNCELSATVETLDRAEANACGHQKMLKVKVQKEKLKGFIDAPEFLDRFYVIVRDSLKEMNLNKNGMKLMIPGIKKTQVGVQMFFLWLGRTYPMLFIDIDFVPTVKAPWPDNLPKPNCGLSSCSFTDVYLNKIDGGEWRLSFGSKETLIMQNLPDNKRNVFLACKMILAALKTESWVPHMINAKFRYWDSRMFSLPSKGGFALKNCFFEELEYITDDREWTSEKLLKRACSIFERMCNIGDPPKSSIDCPKPVKAYFGGDTEKSSIYLCAPEILKFLRNFYKSLTELQEMELD